MSSDKKIMKLEIAKFQNPARLKPLQKINFQKVFVFRRLYRNSPCYFGFWIFMTSWRHVKSELMVTTVKHLTIQQKYHKIPVSKLPICSRNTSTIFAKYVNYEEWLLPGFPFKKLKCECILRRVSLEQTFQSGQTWENGIFFRLSDFLPSYYTHLRDMFA